MGSGRLPWRPTGGRLKVSPPRSAQQMEAEVIICSSVHLLTPHTSMPSLSLSLLLRHCTAKELQIRYCVIGTCCKNCFTSCKHITQLKQFVLLSINTHYHALLCGCDKCFLVYRGPASQPPMPVMETIHRGTAVGPKCSLPPIVQPLHFLINSKSKEKRAISGHSEQINQVNNCRQKVGQPEKKHSATLPQQAAIPGLLCCQHQSISGGGSMEDMGKSMFTCFVSCPFCAPCFRQLSVTEGFPDHCSMEWLSSKQGVSAIIPQTAAGYSILSKFPFLCAYCYCCSAALCCWCSPLLQIWERETHAPDVWCCALLRPLGILFVVARWYLQLWRATKCAELFSLVCSLG